MNLHAKPQALCSEKSSSVFCNWNCLWQLWKSNINQESGELGFTDCVPNPCQLELTYFLHYVCFTLCVLWEVIWDLFFVWDFCLFLCLLGGLLLFGVFFFFKNLYGTIIDSDTRDEDTISIQQIHMGQLE